jgi:Putative DNA-binding domain
MTRLTEIQDAFQRFLTQGDLSIETLVVGTERVPVRARLDIYGDGYRTRLIESLESTFPVLAEVLGPDFETLGARYVAAHPSEFFSIRYYGDRLVQFLASDADYSAAPLLAELARWEWAMAAVFDAADASVIGVEAFATLAPEQWAQLRFEWSPAVEVLELEWNVAGLWKAVTDKTERPEPTLADRPASWLLWRRDLQIYYRLLADDEASLVAASRRGSTFGELCELVCSHVSEQEAPQRAAGYLRGWVESGLITSARLTP